MKGVARVCAGCLALLLSSSRARADELVHAPTEPSYEVRIPVSELGLSEDNLSWSDRAAESFAFAARADHLLTAAELELELAKPERIADLQRFEVLLNGEPIASFSREELASAPRRKIVLDPNLLASTNLVTMRLHTTHDPAGCGRVPVGSWHMLSAGTVVLTSAALPLPHDLEVLPLPFFDPGFDREQVLHFVLTRDASSAQLEAASMVAAWFALQGRGKLSFAAHIGSAPDTLPPDNAVVFIEDLAAAQRLGLTPPRALAAHSRAGDPNEPSLDGEQPVALELRAHPTHSREQLLVVWGVGEGGLLRAARTLLQKGYELSGAVANAEREIALPELAPHQVPRWADSGDVLLGSLPERQPLRVEGGRSQTLRLRFRVVPDLFTWPSDHVELELGYAQGHSAQTAPARLHLTLNGHSLGVLPAGARGCTTVRVPREVLRGYNELALQISYPSSNQQSCDNQGDPDAWVELSKDSRLKLGAVTRFALLPDLSLFLYDGFPFTLHGDLRESVAILPSAPAEAELSTLFGLVAHFASVTGHAPTKLSVQLGMPAVSALHGKDALLIAGARRHTLLSTWSSHLTLAFDASGARAHYPRSASRLRRYLAGRFDDDELMRAQQPLQHGPFAAVMGVPAPWDEQRSLLVITASELARMPRMSELQGYAASERPESDLLLFTDAGRFLFQLAGEHGRGSLPRVLELRFWLAHDWLLLVPLALLAVLFWGRYAFHTLSELARRRLEELDG